MRGKDLLQDISQVDTDLISEAEESLKIKKKALAWTKWAVMAACLCLVVAAAVAVPKLMSSPTQIEDSTGITVTDNGVTIPKREVFLSKSNGVIEDMIGFFIYQCRCYVQYDWSSDAADIIGEHLGTATGLIDEWTPKEGYVDYAGSVSGEFYAVKGFDPSFMLCMKYDNGDIGTYICNTGITMKYGSELYEDRLNLSENYIGVQYETRASWYNSEGNVYLLEGQDNVVRTFINAIDKAEFIPWESVPQKEGYSASAIYGTENYHVYFLLNNGLDVHLRLYENGYVRFQGILDLCVQIPESEFKSFVDALSGTTGQTSVPPVNELSEKLIKCMNDPELGGYIPSFTVGDSVPFLVDVYYYLNPDTAKDSGTKEIRIEYSGLSDPSLSYVITITHRDEYEKNGWAGPMIDVSELSTDTISEYEKKESSNGEPYSFGSKIDIGVRYDEDISVVLSSQGIDAETALLIFQSVNTNK